MEKKQTEKGTCPHHPNQILEEVQVGGAMGVEGLVCPVKECKYEVVIDRSRKDVDFLQGEKAVAIRLASVKLRSGGDEPGKVCTWEFRLPLRTELVEKLSMPRIMKRTFQLMDQPQGIRRADLDYELEGHNIEMRLYPDDKASMKLKSVKLAGFQLLKVEHRGKGIAEDLIHLRFSIDSEIGKRHWNWLHDALGILLDVQLETVQLELEEG